MLKRKNGCLALVGHGRMRRRCGGGSGFDEVVLFSWCKDYSEASRVFLKRIIFFFPIFFINKMENLKKNRSDPGFRIDRTRGLRLGWFEFHLGHASASQAVLAAFVFFWKTEICFGSLKAKSLVRCVCCVFFGSLKEKHLGSMLIALILILF